MHMKRHPRSLALAAALACLAGSVQTREAPPATRALTLEKLNGGGLKRAMSVRSFDKEARTVELAFSSETEVARWFGLEVLDHSPGAVDMGRLLDSAALLVNHDADDQVGVVVSASIDADRKGRAVVRFGNSARAQEIFQDVQDGIRKHVSVGYRITSWEVTGERDGVDIITITGWEPYEISLVAIPADTDVGVGRHLEIPQEDSERTPSQTGNARNSEDPATTGNQSPMEIKIVRDERGNLVRAEVGTDGKIIRVLETLEVAGADVRSAETRGAASAAAGVTSILAMGEQFSRAIPNANELARAAVKAGRTPEEFQRELMTAFGERTARPLDEQTAGADIGMSDRDVRQFSFLRAVRALSPNATPADRKAAAFEFECSETAQRQYGREARGILIPTDVLARAFNAGGAANTPAGATSGANAVATTLMSGSFIEMLRNRTTIMRLGTTMGGLVGNVDIPKQTGGAQGYWVGEGADATEGTPTLGQIAFSPKTVAAFTDLTRRLMMQSTPDAEGIVRRDLNNALAQAIDLAGYYGAGTGATPKGIKNYSGINAVDFAAANPTFAELVQMETEVAADNADIGQMGYVGNARFRGYCKTALKFQAAGSATVWEQGGTVNGYRAEITNQVANGDVFFGNFADLIIAMWGGLDLTVDPYSLSKSGGLRLVAFQDIDLNLRRVESVCWGSALVTP